MGCTRKLKMRKLRNLFENKNEKVIVEVSQLSHFVKNTDFELRANALFFKMVKFK